jgi:hypothetical protein
MTYLMLPNTHLGHTLLGLHAHASNSLPEVSGPFKDVDNSINLAKPILDQLYLLLTIVKSVKTSN